MAERWQSKNFEPLADSMVRAWRQVAQRPTLAGPRDFETPGTGRGYRAATEWGTPRLFCARVRKQKKNSRVRGRSEAKECSKNAEAIKTCCLRCRDGVKERRAEEDFAYPN
jgi:hypothetical protein